MRRGFGIRGRLHARRGFLCSSCPTAVPRRELLLEPPQVVRLRWLVLGGALVHLGHRCLVLCFGCPRLLQLLHVVLVVLRTRRLPLLGLAQVPWRAGVG